MSLSPDELAQLNTLIYQQGLSNAYDASNAKDMKSLLTYMKDHAGESGQHDQYISDVQYKALINHALQEPEVANLRVKDLTQPGTNGQTSRNMTLVNDKTSDMYIVFKGTEGSTGEWGDNFKGLYESDTPDQKAANDYVNKMAEGGDYHITVSGHSKGGNKAMYTAVTNPNVDECYSFDGQGFGSDFMNKYTSQIAANRAHIHAYNYEGDFVSALLYSIAGDVNFTRSGRDPEFRPENHAPMSLFSNSKDFKLDTSGEASDYWKTINNFSIWIMNNVPANQQKAVADLLGLCINDSGKAKEYIQQDPDAFGALIAMLCEYPHTEDLIKQLVYSGKLSDVMASLIMHCLKSKNARSLLLDLLAKKFGIQIDEEWKTRFESSFSATESGIENGARGREVVDVRQEEVRDWSDERMQELLNIVAQVDAEPWWDVTHWDVNYRFEDLIGRLNVENYRNDMDTYLRKQVDMNDVSREDIIAAFNAAEEHHSQYTQDMDEIASNIEGAAAQLAKIYGRLGMLGKR